MRRTLAGKVFATALVAAIALAVILVLGWVVDHRVTGQIDTIRTTYIPKIGLSTQLQTTFEKVSRQLQNSVEAADADSLDDANKIEKRLLDQLVAARAVVDPSTVDTAIHAVETYYRRADQVSRRMIKGETGDNIVRDSESMQREQAAARDWLDRVGKVDEEGLTAAFDSVVVAQSSGARDRLVVSLIGLVAVVLLSIWISRRLYRGLDDLATGFQRFGSGELDRPIRVSSDDELGSVANQANRMAADLQRVKIERDQTDWLRQGQVGLAEKIRGELDLDEVARRAIEYLARYVKAPLGVLYAVEDGRVRPLAGYGIDPATITTSSGLVAEAANRHEVTTIPAPKGELPLRSGLIAGDAQTLVLVPLVVGNRVIGVAELAALDWRPVDTELVVGVREAIAIALEVARARQATRTLLGETQHQATELLSARRGIEQKAEELARASAFKSQFLANMSHELRTPLNAIIGFSELMVDGAIPTDSDTAKEFLGDILTSGRHLLQLINDVLDLSKVEAGKLEFTPATTRLSIVLREVLAILRTTTVKKRIQLTSQIDDAIDEVTLDPARLKQVLYNYLSNALKFTPEGGKVTVRAVAVAPDRFRIEVEDTGPGISAADIATLFVEFQQTAEGARQGSGTGLGLALTKRLVEAQGGSVGLTSIVGTGSVFFAELPREAAITPVVARTISTDAAGKPLILVVEDDPSDREQLTAALEKAGYAVESVSTGHDALERATSRVYDAITLDLLLPDMTGLEVLQQLRSTRNCDAPVVLITIVAERGAVAGFAIHDVLAKPLVDTDLVASLARAGVKPGAGDGAILVVDDDAASLKVIAATLTQLGFDAVCEQDPKNGLRRAVTTRPSAIVLDLIMPGLTGFEFLDQLRKDPAGRTIPVIVWTSKDLTNEERAELRKSVDVIVSKGQEGNARVVSELRSILPGAA